MAPITVCEYKKGAPMSIRGLNVFLASCKMPGDHEIAIARGPYTTTEVVLESRPTFRTERKTGTAVIIPPSPINYAGEFGGYVSGFVVSSSNSLLWPVAPNHSSPALRISLQSGLPPGVLVSMLQAPTNELLATQKQIITASHGLGLKVNIIDPSDLYNDGAFSVLLAHPTVFYVEGVNFKLVISGPNSVFSMGKVPRGSSDVQDRCVCGSILVEPNTPLVFKVNGSVRHQPDGHIFQISYLNSVPTPV
jgi:hypothetical protein